MQNENGKSMRDILAVREMELSGKIGEMKAGDIVREWRGLMDEGLMQREGFLYRVALASPYDPPMNAEKEAEFFAFCAHVEAPELAELYRVGATSFQEFLNHWSNSPDVKYLTARNN
jgi:hypothetical protein